MLGNEGKSRCRHLQVRNCQKSDMVFLIFGSQIDDARVRRMMRVVKPVLMQRFRRHKFQRSAALIWPVGYCLGDDASIRVRPEFDMLGNIRSRGAQRSANVVFGRPGRIDKFDVVISFDQRHQSADFEHQWFVG